MNSIIVIVVIAAIVLFAVYKIKENKEYKESKRKEDEAWEKECQERKKNGEPSVCTKLPGGAANPEEGEPVDIGVDGKSYACAKLYSDSMVINNYRDTAYDFEHKKYECSPVFCMLAYEYHIADYVKRLTGANPMHIVDIRTGLNCIFDLAESYAYPVAVNDDLTQADYYTIRRLKDRKRAMEGNGYYKNAYDFPIDTDKALSYFELLELLRIKCTDKLSEIGNYYTFILSRAWMQTAHLVPQVLEG